MSRQHRTQLETYDGTQTSLFPQKRVLPEEEAEGSNTQTTAKRLKRSNISIEDKLLNSNLSMREHLQKNIQKFLKNENKLNEFRRKSLLSTRLPNGIITKAEDMSGCKPNEIKAYLENHGTKRNHILWQKYVQEHFDEILQQLRAPAPQQPVASTAASSQRPIRDEAGPSTSLPSLPTENIQETEEPLETAQNLEYRTCTTTLNSIIRQDLPQDIKNTFIKKINQTMFNVSNFTSDFQFLIYSLMHNFRNHAISRNIVSQAVEFNQKEGFETISIFPEGFQPTVNIRFSTPSHSEEVMVSNVLQRELRSKKKRM